MQAEAGEPWAPLWDLPPDFQLQIVGFQPKFRFPLHRLFSILAHRISPDSKGRYAYWCERRGGGRTAKGGGGRGVRAIPEQFGGSRSLIVQGKIILWRFG